MSLEAKMEIALKIHNEFIAALEKLPDVAYQAVPALKQTAKALEEEQEQIVKDFIIDFKEMHPKEIEDVFLHGYCYWFAKILELRFEGTIYYLPIDNHFITKIGNNFYDIRGKLNGNQFNPCVNWEEYQLIDELEVSRIYRDCIRKERL